MESIIDDLGPNPVAQDDPGPADRAEPSSAQGQDAAGDDDDGPVDPQAWKKIDHVLDRRCLVRPGRKVRLSQFDPGFVGERVLRRLSKSELKSRAKAMLAENVQQLADAQELLYANDTRSLLIVFQAMDAAGKDGTINHVMSGVNPAGCRVVSFKAPTKHELDHNWLWRIWQAVPERGQICIFNRSHYEDVLVTRVHPELLEHQQLPPGKRDKAFWNARLEDIVGFERHLARNGTAIVKFFLHVSRDEQKRRFLERLDERSKNWKFSVADLAERGHWDEYMDVYEKAISATSTAEAPWYVIPADHKWITRVLVARTVARTLKALKLRPPRLSDADRARLEEAKAQLLAEPG